MANEIASIASAIAATFSAIAALTIVFIQRKNTIDSARPELVIEGWSREIKEVDNNKYDLLVFNKISNVG